jgi:hypothetical protein
MDHSPAHWSLRAALLVVSAFALSAMVGCQGFSAGKPNAQGSQPVPSGDLAAAPASIVFGNVQVGTSQSQTDILSNSGSTSLTLSQATVSGAGFSITGLNLPVTLAAGQSTSVNIAFSPTSSGSATGTLSLTNDGSNSPLSITLSANAVAASTLTASPTSFNFGSVQLGMSQRLTETLNNAGSESVTITQASATGRGFQLYRPCPSINPCPRPKLNLRRRIRSGFRGAEQWPSVIDDQRIGDHIRHGAFWQRRDARQLDRHSR